MLFPLSVTIESDYERNFDEIDGVIGTADLQQSVEVSDGVSGRRAHLPETYDSKSYASFNEG